MACAPICPNWTTPRARIEGRARNVGTALADQASALSMLADGFDRKVGGLREQIDGLTVDLTAKSGEMASAVEGAAARARAEADSMVKAEQDLKRRQSELAETGATLGESLTAVAARLAAESEKMNAAGERTSRTMADAGKQAETQSTALSQLGDAVDAKLARLNTTFAGQIDGLRTVQDHIEAQFATIAKQLQDHAAAVERTVTWAADQSQQVDNALDQRASVLQRTSNKVAEQAETAIQGFREQAISLSEIATDARSAIEQLSELAARTQGDSFMRQAGFIIERLESSAIDISRGMQANVSDDVWQRYHKGDRGIFARKLVGLRDRAVLVDIKARYERDSEFRDHVNRYLVQFEELLSQTKRSGLEDVLNATFLSSDVGRLYVMLARSIGRLNG